MSNANCDGMAHLFEARPNVDRARFGVSNHLSVELAMDFVGKLVQVAWPKVILKRLVIIFEAADDEWKEQFMKDLGPIVQKMRLRRCRVIVCDTTMFWRMGYWQGRRSRCDSR